MFLNHVFLSGMSASYKMDCSTTTPANSGHSLEVYSTDKPKTHKSLYGVWQSFFCIADRAIKSYRPRQKLVGLEVIKIVCI
jgi:hypothetical protein